MALWSGHLVSDAQGNEVTAEILNYKRTGERFWNLLSMTPVRDATGRVMSYIGVQSDITELVRRKEAEKELQEAKARACRHTFFLLPGNGNAPLICDKETSELEQEVPERLGRTLRLLSAKP